MKILEIIPQLSSGGAERFAVDLCNGLSKNNDVILVVLHSLETYGFYKNELNPKVNLICMNKHMGLDLKLFNRLNKLIEKEKPQIVHTHLNAILYTLKSWCHRSNIKFVDTIHNDAEKEAGKGINKWIRKFAFKSGLVYPVTISKESQRSFLNFYNCSSTLILNGRPEYDMRTDISGVLKEISVYKKDNKTKIIVNVARLMPQKNQESLAKAIDELNDRGFLLELLIIGRINEENVISKNLSKFKHTHLLGLKNNPRDYIRAADAFCLSSLYEGMPITLIECFSVGAIPLCTPVGGIKDMICDGENGLLSKGTEERDLIEMFERFCNLTEQEKNVLKINSAASFSKYDMKVCVNNYRDYFISLLN